MSLGPVEIIIILACALLLCGSKVIPRTARVLRGLRGEFAAGRTRETQD